MGDGPGLQPTVALGQPGELPSGAAWLPAADACLGGGLRAEDLCLVGGMQNVGKTIFALQVARNLAAAGDVLPIVVCYEHGPDTLLHRLLCLESVDDPDGPNPHGVTRATIEKAVLAYYDA